MAIEPLVMAPTGQDTADAAVGAVIRAVDAARDALLGDPARTPPLRPFRSCLDDVKEVAGSADLEQVRRVAVEIRRLTGDAWSGSGPHARLVGDTLLRGVDVMSLLALDARRQRQGYPAATLAPAVQMLIEQVARVEAAGGRHGHADHRQPQGAHEPARPRFLRSPDSWPGPHAWSPRDSRSGKAD